MLWRHNPAPWDVKQAPQVGESAKAPSKASLRPPYRHFQTLRLTTQLRQAASMPHICGILEGVKLAATSFLCLMRVFLLDFSSECEASPQKALMRTLER